MLVRAAMTLVGWFGLSITRGESKQLAIDLPRIGQVDIIIDVGVAQGTPNLYSASPAAYLYLVEPLKMYAPEIESLLAKRPGRWIRIAAGSIEGDADFTICNDPRKSGFSPRRSSSLQESRTERVSVRRLDSLFGTEERIIESSGRVLLKIDCEGAELDVLRGAPTLLQYTSIVVIECSIGVSEAAHLWGETATLLKDSGFRLFDILTIGRRHGLPLHADLLFTRADNAKPRESLARSR